MGRIIHILLILFISSYSASGQTLEITPVPMEYEILPGDIGHFEILWRNLPNGKSLSVAIDASEAFSFLNLPSLGDEQHGRASLFFLSHPFTTAGSHPFLIHLISNGEIIASAEISLNVKAKYLVEGKVLQEGKDSVKVLVTNSGNQKIKIKSKEIAAGQSAGWIFERNGNKVLIPAESDQWDTLISLPLYRRFLPHFTPSYRHTTHPLLTSTLTQTWTHNKPLFLLQARLNAEHWTADISQWGSGGNGRLEYSNSQYKGAVGMGNARAHYLFRPSRGMYIRQNWQEHLHLYLDESNQWLRSLWGSEKFSYELGLLRTGEDIFPTGGFQLFNARLKSSYTVLGPIQQVEGLWNTKAIKLQGGLVWVPKALNTLTNQSSNGHFNIQLHKKEWGWNHQSIIQSLSGRIQDFHVTHYYVNKGLWQHNYRTTFYDLGRQSTHQIQSIVRTSQHQFSVRIQSSGVSNKLNRPRLGTVYQYYKQSLNISVGGQEFNNGQWTGTCSIGYHKDKINMRLQGMVLPDHKLNYQYILTRRTKKGQWSLSSSLQQPLRISWNGAILHELTERKTTIYLTSSEGEPISNVKVNVQGQTLQSNEEGLLVVYHLPVDSINLVIDPTTVPFATFPLKGYSLWIPTTKRNNLQTIAFRNTSSIKGNLFIQYDSAEAYRPLVPYNTMHIQMTDSKGNIKTSSIKNDGSFKISGLTEEVYKIECQGLGTYFTSAPLTIYLEEGQQKSINLHIKEIAYRIPIQEL